MPTRPLAIFAVLSIALAITIQADAQPKTLVENIDLQAGDCLVFLGDSITHQRLYTQYVEDFFYTRFPAQRIKFHNAGVGGARAWDALQRFDRDVAAYQPKYVTVLLGMNDGSYQTFNEKVWQTYHDDMTTLIDRITGIDAVPILMTPTMYDSRAALARKRKPAQNYNSVLAYYGTWLREVAQERGFGFVDMWSPLNNITLGQRKVDAEFTLIRDAVHPGASGQLVMAYAIIEDMGLRKAVSNIRITKNRRGRFRARANGGKVTELESSDDGIAFTWASDSLPWIVPEEAEEGARLLKLGHRASREGLQVHGLQSGKYELAIEGQVVGEYTDLQLSRHIELQGNRETPQYQQALRVAELNKQRNQGPISQLRREWSQFQRLARLKRQAEARPDDEKLAEQLREFEERVQGMETRIEEYQREMREIEDQIYESNMPPTRRYVLKRVGA